jgi:hypothetical protein
MILAHRDRPVQSLRSDLKTSLTPLIAYAVTHAHSHQWLRAIAILLEREGRDG